MFSETSRLYAQNYKLLEAVKGEFEKDVDALLASVYGKIESATAGRSRQSIVKARNRYWWIGGEDMEDCPYLWLSGSEPEIVVPGEIALQVCAPDGSTGQLRALRNLASKEEFSSISEPAKGDPGPFSLFTATIKYGDDVDPVQRVSSIAAKLLLAMNDAYQHSSRAASGSSGKQKAARARRAAGVR